MAFKAINNIAGLDNLVFILLVFKTYLYIMELDLSNPFITQCTTAIKKAIAKITKLHIKH